MKRSNKPKHMELRFDPLRRFLRLSVMSSGIMGDAPIRHQLRIAGGVRLFGINWESSTFPVGPGPIVDLGSVQPAIAYVQTA
jgi:hypothetical protein